MPLTVFLYWVIGVKSGVLGAKAIIVIASIVFYGWNRPEMLLYLGISILITYLFTVWIRRKENGNVFLFAIPIVVNVGLLFYCKYYNFTVSNINRFLEKPIEIESIILPIGISFYTFQQIAYIVSIEDGTLKDSNFLDYLVYILFFPKLLMGPITDPVEFISQINDEDTYRFSAGNIAIGIKLFSLGLIKKVLLADAFAKAVSWGYANLEQATSMDCLIMVLAYTFEIYFDFSGYSDMAVGVASLFNITLPINFDSPYKAVSIRDFWKRWHVSLTRFLTRYVYIPLGGSRVSNARIYINTLIVFLISGIWHGANWTFILWGLLHGLFSCFDRMLDKIENKVIKPVRWACTFCVASILWLLFSAPSVEKFMEILRKAAMFHDVNISDGMLDSFRFVEDGFVFNTLGIGSYMGRIRGVHMIIFIAVAFLICIIPKNNYRTKERLNLGTLVLSAGAFIWGLLCLGSESVFIYNGF